MLHYILGIVGGGFVIYAAIKYLSIGSFKPVTEDEVIFAWLYAEATDPSHQFASHYRNEMNRVGLVLDSDPSFEDPEENNKRREVFDNIRGKYALWKPIREHTSWYKTTMILNYQSPYILGPYPPKEIKRSCLNLNNIILWGHSTNGPLIVLEGNHRWYSRYRFLPYVAEVYVGISDQNYKLHAECGCPKCG